ncbi:PAS domain S-box protein [Candidatus Pacearchaeota archaeon]|nr:PAS domain S-box protein [Candidatus Pacearchaeota archaeon]
MREFPKIELERKLEEAKKEVEHYKRIAEQTGNLFLRETEALSKLIFLHKQAEEALRENEEKYRSFIYNAPVAMYTLNAKGEFTYGNRKVLEITGYKKEDWLNKPFYPIIHPDDLDHIIERVGDRLAGNEPTNPYEVRIFNSSGEIMWVKLTAKAIYDTYEKGDKKVVGIQSFFEDITDKKLAEEALVESEEKYRNLVERANDGVIIVQNGKVQFSNSRLAEIFGFTVEKMINTSFLDYVFPDERSRIADIHKRRLQGGDVPEIYEMIGLHKDERRIDLEINSGVITYQGKPATLSFVRDITDRKRAETERLQKEKLQGIVELAGAVCHELNQPLQAISGISYLLMMDIDEDSPIYENIQAINKRVNKMGEITRKLMLVTQYKTKDYLKGKIIDIDKASE